MLSHFHTRLLLVLALSGVAMQLVAQENSSGSNVQYSWAFVARSGGSGPHQIGLISRDTAMKSGDEFKLFVNLSTKAYVYVLHRGSNGDIDLLFPYSLAMFEKDYALDRNYYIPKGREWFTFDKMTGNEAFYVLASKERLTGLEKALSAYTGADSAGKSLAASKVVEEIKNTKKQFRSFSTLAERPLSIAGNVRGERTGTIDPDRIDVASLATEVSANNFFSKTITIDHK